MKSILLVTLLAALFPSCAEYEGATYAGNGDAGGGTGVIHSGITSYYRSRTFMTDLKAGSFSARKAVVSGQNQSKVPLSAIRTAGTVAGGMIAANLSEAVSNNGSKEVINASNNALAATQAKEATKQAANAGKTAVDLAKIAKP